MQLTYLIHRYKHREVGKMRRQRNMFQIREHDTSSVKELNETEINDLPNQEYKLRVMRMLTDLGRRMDELSKNFNKKLENIKKEPIINEEYNTENEKFVRGTQ